MERPPTSRLFIEVEVVHKYPDGSRHVDIEPPRVRLASTSWFPSRSGVVPDDSDVRHSSRSLKHDPSRSADEGSVFPML